MHHVHWTAPALRYKMFLAQNYPIRQGKAKPSRRPPGGGGGGGCAAAGVRRGCRRVVVPPRFVTVPCLCVALGGVACLGRRRLARVSHRGCTAAVTVVARPP